MSLQLSGKSAALPPSPLISAFARQAQKEQPDLSGRALQFSVMRRLGSHNPIVARKVKQVLSKDLTTSAANVDCNMENNSYFSNSSRFLTYGPSSKALDYDSFEEQLDLVTISSFEGSTTMQGFSSIFDSGSVITGSVGAISPIQVKRSPQMEETEAADQILQQQNSLVLEEDKPDDQKCTFCPIC